jgi:hypothetical protein
MSSCGVLSRECDGPVVQTISNPGAGIGRLHAPILLPRRLIKLKSDPRPHDEYAWMRTFVSLRHCEDKPLVDAPKYATSLTSQRDATAVYASMDANVHLVRLQRDAQFRLRRGNMCDRSRQQHAVPLWPQLVRALYRGWSRMSPPRAFELHILAQ